MGIGFVLLIWAIFGIVLACVGAAFLGGASAYFTHGGRYVLGGTGSRAFQPPERNNPQIDSYFILDTQIGKDTVLPNYEALRRASECLGITPKLEPIASVYGKYRFSWFDVVMGITTLPPLLAGAFLLIGYFMRVRRTRPIALQPG